MIKMFCDRCGSLQEAVVYDVRVNTLSHPVPACKDNLGEPRITDDNTHIRFCLCQNCYRKLGLPNPYSRDYQLKFSEPCSDPLDK